MIIYYHRYSFNQLATLQSSSLMVHAEVNSLDILLQSWLTYNSPHAWVHGYAVQLSVHLRIVMHMQRRIMPHTNATPIRTMLPLSSCILEYRIHVQSHIVQDRNLVAFSYSTRILREISGMASIQTH